MARLHPRDEELYARTAQIARESLEIVQRTTNLGTKLKRLDWAEQKLRDLLWLDPEREIPGLDFEETIETIQTDRKQTLQQFAAPEVAHQIGRAEKTQSGNVRMSALRRAGDLLVYCLEEMPDLPQVQELHSRFVSLGGDLVPRDRPDPLSAVHTKLRPSAGCLAGLVTMVAALLRGPRL